MANQNSLGILISVAVALILGVVLITIIAQNTVDKTQTVGASETFNIGSLLDAATTTTYTNQTHGTTFQDGLAGSTFVLASVSEKNGHNLSCTQPVITNATSGHLIAVGNWTWATATQARGRCGIVIGTIDPQFNNSQWNFTYTVTYYNVNATKTLTVTYAPTGWKSTDCPLTNGVLKNATTNGATLADGVDYSMDETTGIFSLRPTLKVNQTEGNNFLGTYSYCDDDYVNVSWARTVLELVPGFFALALLLGAAFVIFYILRNEGIEINI